jgi:hypothetical protein
MVLFARRACLPNCLPLAAKRKLAVRLGSFGDWAVFAHLPRNAAFALSTRLDHLWNAPGSGATPT